MLSLTPMRIVLGVLAAVGGASALFVLLASPLGWRDTTIADVAQDTMTDPDVPGRVGPPSSQNHGIVAECLFTSGEATGEDGFGRPCEGCLAAAGALDVADTFLYHMRYQRYMGARAELYSTIAERLDAAGLPPPHKTFLPKLPAGLVDAPRGYSVGRNVLPKVERPSETWVIWVHMGWMDKQSSISLGDLPATAAAWPPLIQERFMLIDARSGEVFADNIWRHGRHDRSLGPFGDIATQAAGERADHWMSKGRAP